MFFVITLATYLKSKLYGYYGKKFNQLKSNIVIFFIKGGYNKILGFYISIGLQDR